MSMRVIGKLEYAGLNADGKIHLIISKESKEVILTVVQMLRVFEGEDVTLDIRKFGGEKDGGLR